MRCQTKTRQEDMASTRNNKIYVYSSTNCTDIETRRYNIVILLNMRLISLLDTHSVYIYPLGSGRLSQPSTLSVYLSLCPPLSFSLSLSLSLFHTHTHTQPGEAIWVPSRTFQDQFLSKQEQEHNRLATFSSVTPFTNSQVYTKSHAIIRQNLIWR